ncbi:LysR family transcriptional regulator [soil metagenome]
MAINIKYRPLKAFLLAADTGSFTRAAATLGVTQPSFSALIQDLEQTMGLRLFERSTRTIALTESGQDLLSRVQRPLSDLEEAYRSLLDLSAANRGTVILGTLPSVAFALVPPTLAKLRASHPALHARVIEAHNDELLAMVRTNQIDCALATLVEPVSDLAFAPVIADHFFAVFPHGHALASAARIAWSDLLPHDLILLSRGSSARSQFDRALQRRSAAPALEPRYDVTNIITAASMVRHGLGVAVLPRLCLPEIDVTGLTARPIASAGAARTIGLITRRDRVLSPATQRFVEHLMTAADHLLPTLPAATSPPATARKTPRRTRSAP